MVDSSWSDGYSSSPNSSSRLGVSGRKEKEGGEQEGEKRRATCCAVIGRFFADVSKSDGGLTRTTSIVIGHASPVYSVSMCKKACSFIPSSSSYNRFYSLQISPLLSLCVWSLSLLKLCLTILCLLHANHFQISGISVLNGSVCVCVCVSR